MQIILSVDALANPLTGIGRYTLELASGLAKSAQICQLDYLYRGRLVAQLPSPPPTPKSGLATLSKKNNFTRKLLRTGYRLIGPALEYVNLSKHFGKLFHSPNFYFPNYRGSIVVTIHDLSILRYPQYHPIDRVRHLSPHIYRSIAKADLIITDSAFIASEIQERFAVSSDRLATVPLGVSSEFHPRFPDATANVLLPLGLSHGAYTLFAGTIEPRKNLQSLIQAYASLPIPLRQSFPLVLTGTGGWKSSSIHHDIQRAQSEGWLRYLGYTPEADLPVLIAGASCLAMPSMYEGFGLPVLEAMASGVPTVVSQNSAMTEFAGNSTLKVDPLDIESMRQGLVSILDNASMAKELAAIGLRLSRDYTWANTVSKTIEAYGRLKPIV